MSLTDLIDRFNALDLDELPRRVADLTRPIDVGDLAAAGADGREQFIDAVANRVIERLLDACARERNPEPQPHPYEENNNDHYPDRPPRDDRA